MTLNTAYSFLSLNQALRVVTLNSDADSTASDYMNSWLVFKVYSYELSKQLKVTLIPCIVTELKFE